VLIYTLAFLTHFKQFTNEHVPKDIESDEYQAMSNADFPGDTWSQELSDNIENQGFQRV